MNKFLKEEELRQIIGGSVQNSGINWGDQNIISKISGAIASWFGGK